MSRHGYFRSTEIMNKRLQDKIISISNELKHVPNGSNKHFTFIIHRNRILSIGWNDYNLSHPKLVKNGYGLCGMHSELSAIIRYRGNQELLRYCTIVNTRINSFGELGMSKPCPICTRLIQTWGFRKVFFTNREGNWEQYNA